MVDLVVKKILEELEALDIDTDLKIEGESGNNSNGDPVITNEVIDSPTVVRDSQLYFTRPIESYSLTELINVKYDAVADVLAYEAGLSSPGTLSSNDLAEFTDMFEEAINLGSEIDIMSGSDKKQRKMNTCLLMRESKEDAEYIANNLEMEMNRLEKTNDEIIPLILPPESMFEEEPPYEHGVLLDTIVAAEAGALDVEEVRDSIDHLKMYDLLTDTGREALEEFERRLPELEQAYRESGDAIEEAYVQLDAEYNRLIESADPNLMGASLLYRAHSGHGLDDDSSFSDSKRVYDNLEGLDYVTDEMLDVTDTIRAYISDLMLNKDVTIEQALPMAVNQYFENPMY